MAAVVAANAPTWASELQKYEDEKRFTVDEGLLRGPQVRVTNGQIKYKERKFDPLLGRYRDGGTELLQRTFEEKERVAHLNRAQDIQILREQPYHIIRHESRLPEGPETTQKSRSCGAPAHPTTAVDYNLISNLPFDVHHWARPEARPRCVERSPGQQRKVPAFTVKDFNIVTNRYHQNHEAKRKRDQRFELLEATQKYATRNRFDPVTQQFVDPRNEEVARTSDDARDVEIHMRAESQIPPSYKGRESAHYDVVTHKAHNPGMLQAYDVMQDERKERYRNRYIMEHNWHAQDIKGDHIENVRKMNRTAPERFEESTRRGFDIVNNRSYGRGPKAQTLYAPYTVPRQSPWEKATSHQMSATLPSSFGSTGGALSDTGRSLRSSHSRPSSTSRSMRARQYAGRAG